MSPERHNKALLNKRELSMEEIDHVLKNQKLD